MSPNFQVDFVKMDPIPKEASLKSMLVIRHEATRGGYLHSHPFYYETGSKRILMNWLVEQQITLYPHRDGNNWFEVLPKLGKNHLENGIEPIVHGMQIRLQHVATKKKLHSHSTFKPPISSKEDQQEVTCYGSENFEGDSNDNWKIHFVGENQFTWNDGQTTLMERFKNYFQSFDPNTSTLHAIKTRFYLIHVNTGCYLYSHAVKLPEWGFGQQGFRFINSIEVLCSTKAKRSLAVYCLSLKLGGPSIQFEIHASLTKSPIVSSHSWKRCGNCIN